MTTDHPTMPPRSKGAAGPTTSLADGDAEADTAPMLFSPHQPPPWPPPNPGASSNDPSTQGDLLSHITGPMPRGSWTVMFATALLGAVLGATLTGKISPNYEAVALVQGSPARLDPSSLNQEDDRYAQTEAAYAQLAEPEINAAIAERTQNEGLSSAEVSLVAGTTILRFTGHGETAQEAAEAANISAETYVELWRTRSAAALTESLALVNQNISEPADPNSATANTNTVLAEQRAVLDTQLAAVQSLQRVVQPASAETAEQTAGYSSGLILGGLTGLTLGVGALVWQRSRSSRSNHPNLDQVTP